MDNLYYDYQSIWHCQNSSGKLKVIKKILKSYLKGYKYQYDNAGNIFIGDFTKNRPCLVAHIDSVFNKKPKNIKLKKGILRSSNGLGADDKCGIITVLEILKINSSINAILTVDEEIGGIGANKIKNNQIKNVNYFIEVDRQGKNDLVDKIGERIANKEFIADIKGLMKKYKFKLSKGAYTDILDLSYTSRISSINLSAGYYNPHTKDEFVILSELQNTINFVMEVLKYTTCKQFKLPELTYTYDKDIDNLDLSYAINEAKDIKTLLDLGAFCNYKDIESLILKAYDVGLNDKKWLELEYYKNDLVNIDKF